MNILVVGSGGREHAIIWKLKQSPLVEKIYCTGDNAGISELAEIINIKASDAEALINFAKCNDIGLTIVGPEQPLMDGIVDKFMASGLKIFGPNSLAALIEGSKLHAKKLMKSCGVPTAHWTTYNDFDRASGYVTSHGLPIVIKANGLAAGKGVYICSTYDEAKRALKELLIDCKYGRAGDPVIIEDCLAGEEISVLALCDGNSYRILHTSQDHKRVGEGDTGPNTGGMGAIAPVPWVTPELLDRIKEEIFTPILKGFELIGIAFTGCLYAGLMITKNGPKVLEFNVRFGDPETQAILPLMKSDIVPYFLACTDGTLGKLPPIEWLDESVVCVVLAAEGYPSGKPISGQIITGIDETKKSFEEITVFHAGTVIKDGQVVTNGGRILGVTATEPTLHDAISVANLGAEKINFTGKFFRSDIGKRAIKKMEKT